MKFAATYFAEGQMFMVEASQRQAALLDVKAMVYTWSPPYRDRFTAALYMSALSPKSSWHAALCHQICKVERKKVLIFAGWTMTLIKVSAFLMNLGFRAIDIRSVHTAGERQSACDMLNDKDELVDILLTSLRTTAASVNPQKHCANVIYIDVPIGANTAVQAMV